MFKGNNENVLALTSSDGDGLFNIRQSANDCLIRGYKDGNVQNIQIHSDGVSYFNGGSVGIGRTIPSTKLVIQGVYDASATPSAVYGNAANKGLEIICEKNGAWPIGYTYGIDFGAVASLDGTSHYKIAAIYSAVESVPHQVAGQLKFYTTTGASGSTLEERMIIKADGNVGIGTTDPGAYKLNVNGTAKLGALTGTTATFSGDVKAAQFYTGYDWTTRSGGINIGNQGLTTGAVSFYDGVLASSASIYRDSSSVFFVGARGGTTTAGIAIATDGNVGIGTTGPGEKLDVRGEVYILTGSTSVRTLSGILKADTLENSAGTSDLTIQTEAGGNKDILLMPNGTGNVGIGTNAPGAYKLEVTGSDGTDDFDFDVTT